MNTSNQPTQGMTETKPGACELARVASCADALLTQCRAFVEETRAVFTLPCASLMNSTIGQHLRHNLDHFGAAISAFGCADPVDYDHRERGTPVETDPDAAIAVLDDLRERLDALRSGGARDGEITVRMMLTAGGEEAALRSTLSRELAFASHHAIHHHAMMAAIAHAHGAPVPPGFGKAPSTLHHETVATR